MSLKCGEVRTTGADPKKPGSAIWRGTVSVSDLLNGTFTLVTNERSKADNDAPQFDIYYTPEGGKERHAGGAWVKNSVKVSGGDFLSLTFDDPTWPASVNLAAFPPEKDAGKVPWPLTWKRQRAV